MYKVNKLKNAFLGSCQKGISKENIFKLNDFEFTKILTKEDIVSKIPQS